MASTKNTQREYTSEDFTKMKAKIQASPTIILASLSATMTQPRLDKWIKRGVNPEMLQFIRHHVRITSFARDDYDAAVIAMRGPDAFAAMTEAAKVML